MGVTIRDVAKRAGVSPSTVSRVLNKKGVISDDTTKRIKQAMKELKYVPNDFARGFATGSSRTIAIIIDVGEAVSYSNNFFNNTVFGIETAAHRNDYNLLITNGSVAFGGASSAQKLVLGKKIDGIIFPESIINIVNKEFLKSLRDNNFPCVILGDPGNAESETNWIDINNVQAGSLAVQFLHKKGYKRIAFLSDGGKKKFNQNRISGYSRELSALGMSVDENLILHGESSVESGFQEVQALLALKSPPDCVICSSDRLALGAQRAALHEGWKVPQDFGVLSFDNSNLTELALPSITSIDVDTFDLGVQAAEILLNQIENPDRSMRQILLSTKIIERDSTARL